MTPARPRCAVLSLLAILVMAALGGCKDSSTGPEEIFFPPDLVQRQVVAGKVNICVVGPSGDYVFSALHEGGVTGGMLLVDPVFVVAAGQCRDVWLATATTRLADPLTVVTVAGAGRPVEAAYDHISAAATNNDRDYTIGTNTISFLVNVYHGGVVTFFYKGLEP